jgi:hypothetical protein
MKTCRPAPTSLLLLLAACSSPSSPTPEAIDLLGTWRSPGDSWNWSESYSTYPTQDVVTGGCSGELIVDAQSGRSFEGRYSIDCASGPASGRLLEGDIAPDGTVSFRLAPEQGWDPGRGPRASQWQCSTDAERDVFHGSLNGVSLEVSHSERLTCPGATVMVSASFRGERTGRPPG